MTSQNYKYKRYKNEFAEFNINIGRQTGPPAIQTTSGMQSDALETDEWDAAVNEDQCGSQNHVEMEDIMDEIRSEQEDGEVLELDPEVEQMLADLEKTDEFGENVSAVTARTFKSISQFTVTKEVANYWENELKTPENCKEVVVPAVNGPIWSGLSMGAKTGDAKLQALQLNLIRAQVAQMRLMDEMLTSIPKEKIPRLLKPLLTSAKCITAAMQDINQKRRQQLRPFMKAEYAGLNSSRVAVTSNLYGDDLEKSMKEAKVTTNIVKTSMGFQGRPRYHPYKQQQFKTTSLNYNRPSPMMNRGGQNYRFQRPQFQRNQFQSFPNRQVKFPRRQ